MSIRLPPPGYTCSKIECFPAFHCFIDILLTVSVIAFGNIRPWCLRYTMQLSRWPGSWGSGGRLRPLPSIQPWRKASLTAKKSNSFTLDSQIFSSRKRQRVLYLVPAGFAIHSLTNHCMVIVHIEWHKDTYRQRDKYTISPRLSTCNSLKDGISDEFECFF